MARKREVVENGTGNVFTDLGYPNAKERTVKVQLAVEVNRVLKERKHNILGGAGSSVGIQT